MEKIGEMNYISTSYIRFPLHCVKYSYIVVKLKRRHVLVSHHVAVKLQLS